MFNKYPYTDFHELNLDWFLNQFKELVSDWDTFKTDLTAQWEQVSTDWQTLYNYVHDYFDNLDVQQEIDNKLNAMATDGSLLTIMQPTISETTENWLDDNITQPTTPVVDASLTVSGAAADARVTGNLITKNKNSLLVMSEFHSTLDWTIGKTIGSSGSLGTNALGATSSHILASGGDILRRDLPVTDINNIAMTIHVIQWADGVFQSRTSLTANADLILSAGTTSISFNLSRPSSSGVNMIEQDIEDYFTAQLYRKVLPAVDNICNLKSIYIDVSTAASVYNNLLTNVPPNTFGWTSADRWNDAPPLTLFYFFNLRSINGDGPVADQGTQIALDVDTGVIFTRRIRSGAWTDWGRGYDTAPVYYAFGDSLTWGAVWDSDPQTPYYQADVIDRIPTRIANAIGALQFTNGAVSGARYVAQGPDDTTPLIGDAIKAADLTNVDVITIGGGRNDSATALGSGDTATANDGTICGALADIFEYLAANYPKLQIIVYGVTPQPTTSQHDPAHIYTRVFGGGWSLNTFYTEVRKLCNRYGAAFIDWYDCSLILQWGQLSGGYNSGTQNWAHPLSSDIYGQMGRYLGGKCSGIYHS